MLQEGIVRVIEKVMLCPEFIHGVGQIKRACYAAGEEAMRRRFRGNPSLDLSDVLGGSSLSG